MIKRILNALHRRYGQGSAHPYAGLPLVLASGVGRAGTTVLRHSLGAHTALHGTGTENNIVYDLLLTGYHNCTYPSRKATMQVGLPEYERLFRNLILNLLWPRPRTGRRRPLGITGYSALTPERAEFLLRMFPSCHIVYIVRNGIEVTASRMTHPNFRHETFEAHCTEWLKAGAMAKWGAEKPQFVLVRHEELLEPAAAEAAVRRILERCALPYEQACLDHVLKEHYHPTTVATEAEKDSRDMARRHERWRYWTDEQRHMFATICGGTMQYFGYEVPWEKS